jgi:hypothetical protein
MLDHRREKNHAPDPLPLNDMPAPSGRSLGMHHSIVIGAWGRGQSIAANGELRLFNVVQSWLKREGSSKTVRAGGASPGVAN